MANLPPVPGKETPSLSQSNPSQPLVNSSLMVSSPVLMASDPSIQLMRRNSKVAQISLFGLAIVALGCFVLTIFSALGQVKQNQIDAANLEKRAQETRHVNAQLVTDNVEDIENVGELQATDENKIYLNLSSIPSGANVYLDGMYIGQTDDINTFEKRIEKSDENAKIVLALDGYEVAKRSFVRSADFSDTIVLSKVVAAAPVARENVAKDKGDVVANKAMVIGVPTAKPTKKAGSANSGSSKAKKDAGKKAAQPAASDIILPD